MSKRFASFTLAAMNLALAAMAFVACDEVAENERLIYVAPAEVNRAVLIEDFTGQKCVNCPNATETIEAMQEQYGDAIIAVAIHGGGFGISTSETKYVGLATDEAKEYYEKWNITEQPTGLINRRGGGMEYQMWGSAVKEELEQKSTVDLTLRTSATETGEMQIQVVCTPSGNYNGKLQLWLLEDNIVARQAQPDGKMQKEYNHMHVYRASINGIWGTDIDLSQAVVTSDFTYKVNPEAYNLEQLSVVAFVYNDQGVENVIKAPVVLKKRD